MLDIIIEILKAPVKFCLLLLGSAIIIDGLVVHKSAHNHSDHGRHIYTFHIYDHAEAKWSPRNW